VGFGDYEVPDGIEPLIGYRGWIVRGGKLLSCYREIEWPIGGPLVSECLNPTFATLNQHPLGRHSSPDISCTCGVYALNEYPDIWEVREGERRDTLKPWPYEAITGMVKSWGRIIIGDRGFRAQYAEPIALVAKPQRGWWPKIIKDLAEAYGIEILDAKEVRRKL